MGVSHTNNFHSTYNQNHFRNLREGGHQHYVGTMQQQQAMSKGGSEFSLFVCVCLFVFFLVMICGRLV